MALGEVAGLEAVGVVLVLGPALLAGGLIAGQLGGANLQGKVGAKLGEDMLAEDAFVHGPGLFTNDDKPGVRV